MDIEHITATRSGDSVSLQFIVSEIRNNRIRVSTEMMMQADVAHVLWMHEIEFEWEYRFDRSDRVDLFVKLFGIAIECKVKGSPTCVADQLLRYASKPEVKSIILVTSKVSHAKLLSRRESLGGKPLKVVFTGGQL